MESVIPNRTVGSGTQFLRIGQKLLSKLRQADLTADPVEQRNTELLLKLGDLRTDVGLRISEIPCCLREVF